MRQEINEHGVSDRLVDRLRGKYAMGPHLPNGKPEFGWKQFESPPIQHEAADRIEMLEKALQLIFDNSGNVGISLTAKLALENALNGVYDD